MAVALTWGGGNAIAWSSGGDTPGAFAGSPSDPAVDRRKPRAPREFTAFALDGGGVKAKWRDQGDPVRGIPMSGSGNHEPIVNQWDLRICPVQLAGTEQDPEFALKVLELSESIASVASFHNGSYRSITVADPEMRDVYVLMVGISVDGIAGVPSTPLLISPLNAPLGPLNDITAADLDLVQVLDTYGNEFVELNPSFKAPNVLGRFFGVQLIGDGYLGLATERVLGNVVRYEGKPGGQLQAGSIILPDDVAANPVTIYFVSVDRQGHHIDDITTAPSIAVPGGIHV